MTAKSLPSGYAQIDRWSLKQASRRDVLLVGVVGLVIMLMSLAAASFVVEATSDSDVITLEGEVFIIGLGVGTVLGIVLHELVHGVFFFVFGGRPRFGFKPWTRFGPVFYAAAPGSYLRRADYIGVGLAPAVLVTALLMIVLVFVSAGGLLFAIVLWAFLLNAVGSAGDLLIIRKVISYSSTIYFEDTADGFFAYGLTSGQESS